MIWLNRLKEWFQDLHDEINSAPGKYSLVLLILISVMEIAFILKGHWAGDFWEHSAVLKELIRAPLEPMHPILRADLPHAFFSPYLVTLGFIGNLFNATPVPVLSAAAVLNLFLWLYGLFLFVKTFYPDKVWSIYFYLLLLHLFGWGPLPWIYSSFFHFNTLHYVLPYPSTFAVALTFISTYLLSLTLEVMRRRVALVPVIILLNSIILLTHPTSFLLALTLAGIVVIRRIGKNFLSSATLAFICVSAPFVVALAWPYYPFWDLLLSESSGSQFHQDSELLYDRFLIRIAPALFAFLLIRREDLIDKNSPILLFIALLSIYAYGFFSGQFGYGRVIAFMVLALHLLMAYKLSTMTIPGSRQFLIILLFIASCLPFIFHSVKTVYTQITFQPDKYYGRYEFLRTHLTFNAVVITDRSALRMVPAFGGRVAASIFPPYWIHDNEERMRDLDVFFSGNATVARRRSIMEKYQALFVLLNHQQADLKASLCDSLNLTLEYQNEHFILLAAGNGKIE